MQIVINLPKYVVGLCCEDNVTAPVDIATLIHAVKGGAPLPKGHGRLIDADDIDNHIIGYVDTRSCPTIIEADKE